MHAALRLIGIALTILLLGRHMHADAGDASIELVLTSDPYAPTGAAVTCELWLDMSCDPNVPPATCYQAFLGFATERLEFVSGEYDLAAFGLPILPIEDAGGALDLAAGLNPFAGQDPVCGRHLLATLNFIAVADGQGCCYLFFRDHYPATSIFNEDVERIIPELVSTPPSVQAVDYDADCDVDFADFDVFSFCLAGPDIVTPPPECDPVDFAASDSDNDEDVDLPDFAHFQTVFTGS